MPLVNMYVITLFSSIRRKAGRCFRGCETSSKAQVIFCKISFDQEQRLKSRFWHFKTCGSYSVLVFDQWIRRWRPSPTQKKHCAQRMGRTIFCV
ncbi:hypothetical protein ACROYT_G016680 [Oculina patagonica]